MVLVHGTCIDLAGVAVLLRGPAGSGKSDLALRLIDQGARLIADDQVEVERAADALMARAPKEIAGMMEVRGVGLVAVPWQARGRLGLVVDLVSPEKVERLPEPGTTSCQGVDLARLALTPFEASACAKVRLAARATQETPGTVEPKR